MRAKAKRVAQAVGLGLIVCFAPALRGQALAAEAAPIPSEARDAAWLAATAKYAPMRKKILEKVAVGDAAGPFRPDWQSLATHETPKWYADAKFGIFIHWGLYSVPAFGSEWYSRLMYTQGDKDYEHHIKTYGPQNKFGYKDFIPLFKAQKYDPAAWAKLFHDAGARYVVPVAEHHDGFSMYDSHLSDWTAVKMGPKRDLIGEFAKAARAEGLHFALSSHRAEHDWFFDEGRKIDSDVNDPAYAGLYGPAQTRIAGKTDEDLFGDYTYVSQAWLDDWLARQAELVDAYHPDLIYFDWWIGQPSYRNTLPKFLAYYYNAKAKTGEAGVVNYKLGEMADGSGTLDIERGQAPGIRSDVWQTCTSLSNDSWGYIEHDTYKSPEQILHLMADVVSKNGNLLLNVGPRADGSIPEAAQDTLLKVGAWLKINGEAIYGARPWIVFGEGPTEVASGTFQETKTKPYTSEDFRFTTHGATLYAIEMAWPKTGEAVIHSVHRDYAVRKVTLVATGETLNFRQADDGLHLQLPKQTPGDYAYVYRIETQ